MKRGKLIVLEGCEGAGKTTILRRLEKEGLKSGEKFITTREPGGTEFAEKIRKILFSEEGKTLNPLTQFFLFWAARIDHVVKKIVVALESGVHVITDRFDMSTFAYQIFGDGQVHLGQLFNLAHEALRMFMPPPIYIYLDIDPEIGLMRKAADSDKANSNFFDDKELEFHRRVRKGYLEFTGLARVIIIDASRSPDEVWYEFRNVLDKALA